MQHSPTPYHRLHENLCNELSRVRYCSFKSLSHFHFKTSFKNTTLGLPITSSDNCVVSRSLLTQKLSQKQRQWLVHPSSHATHPACHLVSKVTKFALHRKNWVLHQNCRRARPSEWPKFAHKCPQTCQPPLGYYTCDAGDFACQVASKAQKFNSLFNFKNLKRRYLYEINLH